MTRTKRVATAVLLTAVAALIAVALTAGALEWKRGRDRVQSADQEITDKAIEKLQADRAADERQRAFDEHLRRELLKEQLCWYQRQNYYDEMRNIFGDDWRRMATHAPLCDWGDRVVEPHKADKLPVPTHPPPPNVRY